MKAPKQTDILLLLEVFRRGLVLDLVSPKDVTSWADELIMNTDEPDYFLIEVSLSSNTNQLIEVIGAHADGNNNQICTRVLMGLLYKTLIDDNNAITIDDAIGMLWNLEWRDTLTDYELGFIYSFNDYGFIEDKELKEDVMSFLSAYAPFTLTNYNNWPIINGLVIKVLNKIGAEYETKIAAITEEWRVKRENLKNERFKATRKQKLKRNINVGILIIIIVAIVLWAYLTPSSSPIDWGAIIGSVVICVLFIWKEYIFKMRKG